MFRRDGTLFLHDMLESVQKIEQYVQIFYSGDLV